MPRLAIIALITTGLAIAGLSVETAYGQTKVVVVPLGDDAVTAPREEVESGGSRFDATQTYKILESDTLQGSISVAGDVDYYQLFMPFCVQVTAETQAVGSDTCLAGGKINSKITILNSTESLLIGTNDNIAAGNTCSRAQGVSAAHSCARGFYYVRVQASDSCPSCTFNYRLKLTYTPWLC